jgi:ribosome maturation factor RimP
MKETALIQKISELIAPIGYEVVHLEVQTQRNRVLRLFIDFTQAPDGKAVGIEDCANVSRHLDEPLDQMPELEALFGGAPYELEVSSPGVDRPLRTLRDYERFAGKTIRVHVFRPLTAEELSNAEFQSKNPKQKNFVGTLKSLEGQEKIRMDLDPASGPKGVVTIPLSLVSKANLEPKFDL